MTTFLIALAVFLAAVAGMAVGVILSNRSIKGSCGGLAGLRDSAGNTLCEACRTPSPDCRGPESSADESNQPLADQDGARPTAASRCN